MDNPNTDPDREPDSRDVEAPPRPRRGGSTSCASGTRPGRTPWTPAAALGGTPAFTQAQRAYLDPIGERLRTNW